MFIHRIRSGSKKQFLKLLLRESYRVGGKTKQRTLINLTSWKEDDIKLLELALKMRRASKSGDETAATVENQIYALVANRVTTSKPYAAFQILASLKRPHGYKSSTGRTPVRTSKSNSAQLAEEQKPAWRESGFCEPVRS